jgi:serine/threonine protein kinase
MSNDEPTKGFDRVSSVQSAPLIGTVFGNFRLDDVLGEGAYGVVYKARDLITDRDVALKMLRADDAGTRESLLNEARKAAKLQHVNIVPILHVLSEPETPLFFVMEYVQGETLAAVIRQEAPLPQEAVLMVARDIAAGLSHAHTNGIVHLDIKSVNILVASSTGQAKITDFGMAMHHSERWSRDRGGTLLYMAPEQLDRRPEQYDGRTDIWAVGVLLYEMLTGKKPFGTDNSGSEKQVIEEIVRVHPRPPSQWNAAVSASVDAICLKCLEKDIAARYPSALRLLEDIEKAQQSFSGPKADQESSDSVTRHLSRPQMAAAGCLLVVGAVMIVVLLVLGIQNPDEAGRFLKRLIKIF